MLVPSAKPTEPGKVAAGSIITCTDRGNRTLGLCLLAVCLRSLVQRVEGHSTPRFADEAGTLRVNFGITKAYYMFH